MSSDYCCAVLFAVFRCASKKSNIAGEIWRDDAAVIAAGHLDILHFDPELLHLRDHRARALHVDRRIVVAVNDELGDALDAFSSVAGAPDPENGAMAAQMSGYFGASFHVPMPPIEWPIR